MAVPEEVRLRLVRAGNQRRLGVIREMLEWWPDMTTEVRAWMTTERDKLIRELEEKCPCKP